MSNINNRLVFFNKEGYPYNFRLDENNIWNGKILFDPNGTDTFKTLALYTLEQVDSITYNDTFDIINNEIYNDSGMTISTQAYTNEVITDILPVNNSGDFYSKWVYGLNINKKFPLGTVVNISGNQTNLISYGGSGFTSNNFFTVVSNKLNAVMIINSYNNSTFNFNYSGYKSASNNVPLYLNSVPCVSVPEFKRNLINILSIDDKVSLIGSTYNDGVYSITNTGITLTGIYDYNLSGLTTGDIIKAELKLLTERPLIYFGQLSITDIGTRVTFDNGINSNINIGTVFTLQNESGIPINSSYDYTVTGFVDSIKIFTDDVIFSGYTFINIEGQNENSFTMITDNIYDIKIGDQLAFYSSTGLNNNLKRSVVDIVTTGNTYIIYFDQIVHTETITLTYDVYKILKKHQQNIAMVSSLSTSDYTGNAYCYSTTNILTYTQEVPLNGYNEAIDSFANRYKLNFKSFGIDIYHLGNKLVFEGIYGGYAKYFNISLYKNDVLINTNKTYTDTNSNTNIYNMIVSGNTTKYERYNLSNDLSKSFYTDVILDIFNDVQDFGFMVTLNGVQYYIGYNNSTGTIGTIQDFITKYSNALYKNGFDVTSGQTISGSTTLNHLYINGHEPNVDVIDFTVKVNKNSTYTINQQVKNKLMMVSSNKIHSDTINFIDIGYSTGMIISVSGSNLLNFKDSKSSLFIQNILNLSCSFAFLIAFLFFVLTITP